MARALWTGSVTFGLVNVPVRMYAAIAESRPQFHQIDRQTRERIRYRRVSSESGREVGSDEVVKGYDVGDGRYVLVEPEELEALESERSRAIEIECFVELAEIDPAVWDRFYYLGPGGDGPVAKGYALLVRALEESRRAGIARLVWHGREHLSALRVRDGVLALDTLRFAHEIREPADVLDQLPDLGQVPKRDLDLAIRLIDEMSEDWEHSAYRDTWRERVLELLEDRARGKKTTIGKARKKERGGQVIDFTEALQRSIAERSGGRRRMRRVRRSRSGRRELASLSKDQLYQRAAEAEIPGRSRMSKVELIEALQERAS